MFLNFQRSSEGMAGGDFPSVFSVDTHRTQPRLPPRLGKDKKQSNAAQTLLFLLVTLALFGVIIEACLIFNIYRFEKDDSPSVSKQTGEETGNDIGELLPSKPVAHLTDGQDVHPDEHVMSWSMNAEPLLYEMEYRENKLFIQKEGFYFIYSKVFFFDTGSFYHSVAMQTERYAGKSITLLQSRRFSSGKQREPKSYSNSYLGGVFHLFKNAAIYVNISDTRQIIRSKSYENVFGAYMI